MTYFIVYETKNKQNGKVYRGAHRTKDLNDGYMGSGVALKRAIDKYGKDNFETTILEMCKDEDEMWKREEELVEIGEHSYNLTPGGKGGFDHIDNTGDNNPMRNPEVAARMVASARAKGSYYTESKREASMRNLQKAVEVNTGTPRSESFKKKVSASTQKYWAENREQIRDRMSSWFELKSPDGEVYKTNRLEDLCKSLGLPYVTIWVASEKGRPPNRGKAKGWTCRKI